MKTQGFSLKIKIWCVCLIIAGSFFGSQTKASAASINITLSKPTFIAGEDVVIKWSAPISQISQYLYVWKAPYNNANLVWDNSVTGNYKNIGPLPAGNYRIIMNPQGSLGGGTISNTVNFTVKENIVNSDSPWSSATRYDTDLSASKSTNLVIITHGVCGSASDSWMAHMRDDIVKADTKNTALRLYDWSAGSGATTICKVSNNIGNPLAAYGNAAKEGGYLAQQIEALDPMPTHIHLIAHSAGANVIQKAVDRLADDYYNGEIKKAPSIQLTFLDAFIPNSADQKTFGDLSGGHTGHVLSGYAEQYVDTEYLPYTNIKLPRAVNFDVTPVDPLKGALGNIEHHTWAIDLYTSSITGVCGKSLCPSYKNLGFSFSDESLFKVNRRSDLIGYNCMVNNVSQPYASCSKIK